MKYLRELGVHRVHVVEMQRKDKKNGQGQNLVIVFERDDGSRIDGVFSIPFNDFSKKALDSFMLACGVPGPLSEIQKTKDKELAIFVAPSPNPKGGDYWNVRGYFPLRYLKDSSLNDLDLGDAPPPPGDELPF